MCRNTVSTTGRMCLAHRISRPLSILPVWWVHCCQTLQQWIFLQCSRGADAPASIVSVRCPLGFLPGWDNKHGVKLRTFSDYAAYLPDQQHRFSIQSPRESPPPPQALAPSWHANNAPSGCPSALIYYLQPHFEGCWLILCLSRRNSYHADLAPQVWPPPAYLQSWPGQRPGRRYVTRGAPTKKNHNFHFIIRETCSGNHFALWSLCNATHTHHIVLIESRTGWMWIPHNTICIAIKKFFYSRFVLSWTPFKLGKQEWSALQGLESRGLKHHFAI